VFCWPCLYVRVLLVEGGAEKCVVDQHKVREGVLESNASRQPAALTNPRAAVAAGRPRDSSIEKVSDSAIGNACCGTLRKTVPEKAPALRGLKGWFLGFPTT